MFHRYPPFELILIVVLAAFAGLVWADDPTVMTVGFQPHVVNQKGGGIDWTSGEIIAEGIGKARGIRVSDRLGAERAASLVAARNALAIANGIQIDADGRVGNVRNGQITLKGVVKGQRVVEKTFDKSKRPPEYHVKLRVPLWGVTGICTVYSDAQRRVAVQHGGRRLVLVNGAADVSDTVLVIDARGRKIETCLFPSVVTDDGAVVYDIATRSDPNATSQPPVRYVETDMTFANLRASLDAPATCLENVPRTAFTSLDVSGESGFFTATSVLATPATLFELPGPTSQATTRPGRRRVVVKAAAPTGKDQTQIVLTKEDAEKLRTSPEGANLLRSGNVIVVVDSAAAGMQGRLLQDNDDTSLASSD